MFLIYSIFISLYLSIEKQEIIKIKQIEQGKNKFLIELLLNDRKEINKKIEYSKERYNMEGEVYFIVKLYEENEEINPKEWIVDINPPVYKNSEYIEVLPNIENKIELVIPLKENELEVIENIDNTGKVSYYELCKGKKYKIKVLLNIEGKNYIMSEKTDFIIY